MTPRPFELEDRMLFILLEDKLYNLMGAFGTIDEVDNGPDTSNVRQMLSRARRKLAPAGHPRDFKDLVLASGLNKVIVGVAWITGRDNIGVVVTINERKEYKARIGIIPVKGEEKDAIHVAEYGSKIDLESARLLVKSQGSYAFIIY